MDLKPYLHNLGFSHDEKPSLLAIKKRWKDLCGQHHPDKGGDTVEFVKVTHAYKMLTDSEYRHKEILKQVRQKPNMKGDLNIRIQLFLTFEEAFFGKTVVISYSKIEFNENFDKVITKNKLEVESETLHVPAGSMRGLEVLIRNGGNLCKEHYGEGLVTFQVMPHSKYKCEGMDILCTEPIPLDLMITGGAIEVVTMFGARNIKIPPGTTPRDKIILPKHGVNKTGNHVIIPEPVFPTRQELKTGAWKSMDIDWGGGIETDKDEEDLIKKFEKLSQ